MEIIDNEEEFYSSINVTGIFSFEKDTPIDNWLCNSIESFMYDSINLPMDWVEVTEVHKRNKWPLFVSLSMDRIEQERHYISVAAFEFLDQKDCNTMLKEIMDKSAFSSSNPKKKECKGSLIY